MAWQSLAAAIRLAASTAAWSVVQTIATTATTRLPALAAGREGNLHLAYVVGDEGADKHLYLVRRDQASGTWSPAEWVGAFGLPASASGFTDTPPALATDEGGNLFAVWRQNQRGGTADLLLRQRSGDGIWGATEWKGSSYYCGLDLVVDNDGLPHWISGQAGEAPNRIIVNGANVMGDELLDHSCYPTLAPGPQGRQVAVWQAQGDDADQPERLYLAVQPPVSKRYYATPLARAGRRPSAFMITAPAFTIRSPAALSNQTALCRSLGIRRRLIGMRMFITTR